MSNHFRAFFESLYKCLARGARAVLQVYPENVHQRELILGFAMRAGFAGGVVVDFPHRYLFDFFFLLNKHVSWNLSQLNTFSTLLFVDLKFFPSSLQLPNYMSSIWCRRVCYSYSQSQNVALSRWSEKLSKQSEILIVILERWSNVAFAWLLL